MILHVPHSSMKIPNQFRDQIVLSDDELANELLLMTDTFTDEIYFYKNALTIQFPISRLLLDVERFPDDFEEPMSKVGMGVIYKKTAFGKKLKRDLQANERDELLSKYYYGHHQKLLKEAKGELVTYGRAVIVDCHSFPNQPLPCDADKSTPRPHFCIGTDAFHTPNKLLELVETQLKRAHHDVQINQPYNGTVVPTEFYQKDSRIMSIMIEINRSLYMDEELGIKRDSFESIKMEIKNVLNSIDKFQQVA